MAAAGGAELGGLVRLLAQLAGEGALPAAAARLARSGRPEAARCSRALGAGAMAAAAALVGVESVGRRGGVGEAALFAVPEGVFVAALRLAAVEPAQARLGFGAAHELAAANLPAQKTPRFELPNCRDRMEIYPKSSVQKHSLKCCRFTVGARPICWVCRRGDPRHRQASSLGA